MSEIEKMSAEDFARTVDAVYYDYHGLRARTDENMAGVDVEHMRVQAELVRRLAELDALRAERRDALRLMAILISRAGGELRVSRRELESVSPRVTVVRYDEPETGDIVFTLALGAQEGSGDGE
jgi:hypothetical protein